MDDNSLAPVDAVERAMVTIRRRQSRRVIAESLRRQGISASSIAVSEILDVIDGRQATSRDSTVTDIAGHLRLDQPRVTRLVASAVADGLLHRAADQRDGRRSLVLLTPAGRRMLEQARSDRRARFEQAMFDWSAAERADFADLLTRFVAALDQPRAAAEG